jgi:hypothetical protein
MHWLTSNRVVRFTLNTVGRNTRETQEAKIGSLELSVKDTQTVDVPVWAGVVAVVAGGVLLLVASKKS